MLVITLGFLFFVYFQVRFIFFSDTHYTPSRFSFLFSSLDRMLNNVTSSLVGNSLFYFLLICFLTINVTSNIPLSSIPTMFYSVSFSLSLIFWLPIIICVSITQLNDFIAHMLPYGCPISLSLFLPLVEIFSQLIRPLTLIIRLSTNLSAGHIMIYMFSYFTLLSSALTPFISVVLSVLFVLELAISALQAYIFVTLMSLYVNETL